MSFFCYFDHTISLNTLSLHELCSPPSFLQEDNSTCVCSGGYCTGLFFGACIYTGMKFVIIVTYLHQYMGFVDECNYMGARGRPYSYTRRQIPCAHVATLQLTCIPVLCAITAKAISPMSRHHRCLVYLPDSGFFLGLSVSVLANPEMPA